VIWSSIGRTDSVKKELREAIELPFTRYQRGVSGAEVVAICRDAELLITPEMLDSHTEGGSLHVLNCSVSILVC
jgi:SpoVK/Ycf46/Vps4 family AAA+-type ATPase